MPKHRPVNIPPALTLELPIRFLRGSYGRLILTIIALTCAVAFVCAMALVNRAVLTAFVEVVDTMAGRAALTVTGGGAPFAEEVTEQLIKVPGVYRAVPVVSATAFTGDASGELLTIHGVDVTDEGAVRVYEARDARGLEIDDPLVFLNQQNSVIVTRTLAHRRGLRVGDPLELVTPTGRHTFIVRGMLEPSGLARAYAGNLVVMDLPAAEATFIRRGMVNRIDIVLHPDAQIDAVTLAMEGMLPSGLRVERPSQRKADLNRVIGSLQVMLDAISGIGLAAAFLIILNRLTTVFETRSWQLGIMHAIGMRPRAIWFELLKESVLLGGVGVLVGVPLGIAVGRLLLPVVATTAALNFKLITTETNLTVGAGALLIAAVLGIGTAALAATIPAWRVAHRSPIETIRGRGVTLPTRESTGWILRAVIATAAVTTLTMQYLTQTATWGLAATALLVVLIALAARPVLQVVAPRLLQGLAAVLGPSVDLAGSSIRRNSSRAVLTIALLGVGIGAILWLRMLAFSFETTLVEALSGAMQADWVVSASHAAQGFLEAPLDEKLLADIGELDGVSEVVGERLMDWTYQGQSIAFDAFDGSYFASTAFGRLPLIGATISNPWDAVAMGTAVLVSGNFPLAPGDTMHLDTPTGPLVVTVAGMTIDFGSPGGTIVMARELYRDYWGDAQVNRLFVRTLPGAYAQDVRRRIEQTFGEAYGLRIISGAALMKYFVTQVRRAFAPLDVLAALMLIVLFVGLADTLAASTLERAVDLAVTRALGARRALLARATVAEALSVGTPGVLLAILGGITLGAIWVRQTFPLLIGWPLETHIPYRQIMAISGITLLVCWLAGRVSVRAATSVDPARALRIE